MAFGTVGSNIVFAIHSTGAGKLKANMAIAAAAIFAVGAALNSVRKSANEYSEIWRQLTPQLREAGIVADNAAKGLIDTTAVLKQMAVQEKAGITVTNEYATAMAKLATVEGQKLGKSAQEITADFERLSEGIAKGSTRALKEYGIEIDNTEDLLLSQNEAMDKVIQRAKDLTVEIRTLDQATYAFGNQVDTFTGNLWDWVTKSDAFTSTIGDASESFGVLNTELMETDGALLDAITNTLELQDAFALLGGPLTMAINWFGSLNGRIEDVLETTMDYTNAIKSGNIFGFTPDAVGVGSIMEDSASFTGGGTSKKKDPKKPPKGGGGRKKIDEMVFTVDEIEGMDRAAVSELTDPALASPSALSTESLLLMGEFNILLQERLDIEKELDSMSSPQDELILRQEEAIAAAEQTAAMQQLEYDNRFGHQERLWELDLQQSEREKQVQLEKHQWMLQNSEEYAQRQRDITLSEWSARMNIVNKGIGGIGSLIDKENKSSFNAYKTLAIAQTTISTIVSSMEMFKAGAQFPYPLNLVMPWALMGSAVAVGIGQIAAISKQQYKSSGGGGLSAGISGSGGGGFSGGGGGGIAQTPTGGGSEPKTIIVKVGESTLMEALVDMNDSASQSGSASFSRAS